MFVQIRIILCILTAVVAGIEFETPEYIRPCYKSDPNLNQCILKSFNHLRPYLVNGIAELQVPSIEPLVVPRLVMENSVGAVRVRAQFTNISVTGPSNYELTDIKADLDNWKIEISLKLPHVEMTGSYEVAGQVLLFPIRSKGDFWAAFDNSNGTVHIWGKMVKNKDGIRFMKIDKLIVVDFAVGKSRFKVKDFLNYQGIIGVALNQFLNQNSKEIIEEMKPAASLSIARHFKNLLNAAFLKVPLEVWLPDA